MLKLEIPGFANLVLSHLVLDFNGTLAADGRLIEGVDGRLRALSDLLSIHVVTGDTHGTARTQLQDLPVALTVLPSEGQAEAKRALVRGLGPSETVCIGNGRNDHLMLSEAALGIAVTGMEGTAGQTLSVAHLFVPNITDALDLLRFPARLVATLRA